MSTSVTITLIICATIVLISLINAIETAVAANKGLKQFKDIFKEDK